MKDVVAGEAAFQAKHPGVTFSKFAVTNQFFNEVAKYQAAHNEVTLKDQTDLEELLLEYPVTLFEIEKQVFS